MTRPHRITERGLLLRDGLGTELTIPLRAVQSARTKLRGNMGRSGFTVDGDTGLLAHGDATVRITLDPEVPVEVARRSTTPTLTTLFVTVDEPREFARELTAWRAGLEWSGAGGRGDRVAGP